MTVPAAAWTGTLPISSPPTLRAPPGKQVSENPSWRPASPGGQARHKRPGR
jgi:hypothetical protein